VHKTIDEERDEEHDEEQEEEGGERETDDKTYKPPRNEKNNLNTLTDPKMTESKNYDDYTKTSLVAQAW
jgi:hypothetical protein